MRNEGNSTTISSVDSARSIATKRPQTVTPEGERIDPLIDGVRIRPARTHSDARGTLCEIYDPAWGFSDEPLVYSYQVTIRPGITKGWVQHRTYDDRLFFSLGTARVVLYDDRDDSPTRGLVNERCFDEHNRSLVRIPAGVWHAVTNVGTTDCLMVNVPTRPYRHEDPDKWELPPDTDAIPYRL
jgi:dTDP-4-dehydrorhamnose 3,5-epimerase